MPELDSLIDQTLREIQELESQARSVPFQSSIAIVVNQRFVCFFKRKDAGWRMNGGKYKHSFLPFVFC